MIIVLMFCRLPEQSYFSCLKRSGKQEQRHIANSKRVVAVIPFGVFFVLGIKRPPSLVITTLKPSSLLNRLHLYFWYFLPSCPQWHLRRLGPQHFYHLVSIPSLVASVAAVSSMAASLWVNRVTVNLVIHRHVSVYRIGVVSSFII